MSILTSLLATSKNKKNYGWVIVTSFIFIGTALWGIRFSYGIFFKSIAAEFDINRATASSVLSTYMILGCLVMFMGGWALDRFGPKIVVFIMGIVTAVSLLLTSQVTSLWQLYLTYGLLLSLGTSSIHAIIVSTVARWFTQRRGFAIGIATAGEALGAVFLAPAAGFLITLYDWRIAYAVLAVAVLVIVVPLSLLLRKYSPEVSPLSSSTGSGPAVLDGQILKAGNSQSLSLVQSMRTRSFWYIIVSWLFLGANLFFVTTHLVPDITDVGFSTTEAALVFGVAGMFSLIGRIVIGVVADRAGSKTAALICTSMWVVAMVWLAWSKELWMFYVFAVFFGISWGGINSSMAALVADTFGLASMGVVIGVLDAGFGAGAAIGPIVGGLVFDAGNSYFPAFMLGSGGVLIATILTALVGRETRKAGL